MDTSLQAQIESCFNTFKTSGDWKLHLQELLDLQEMLLECHTNQQLGPMPLVVGALLPLAEYIRPSIASIRSEVVKKTCSVIACFGATCGAEFAPFADQVLCDLLNTAAVKTRVFAQAGEDCMEVLSRQSRYDLELLMDHFDRARTEEVRALVVKQLPTILASWDKAEVDLHFDRLKLLVGKALKDKTELVRLAARGAFCAIGDTWDEHIDHLVSIPSPRFHEAFVKEHASARLTTELVTKFGTPGSATKRTPLFRRQSLSQGFESRSSGDGGGDDALLAPRRQLTFDDDVGLSSAPPLSPVAAPSRAPMSIDVSPEQPEMLSPEDRVHTSTSSSPRMPMSTNKTHTQPSGAMPSFLDRILGLLVGLSVLFAVYGVVGAICGAVALNRTGGVMLELRQLDDSVALTFRELQSKEVAMDAVMDQLLVSMDTHRAESESALQGLRRSSAAWNKSMRDDMEAFKVEFLTRLRPNYTTTTTV
ncbi:Aste57867_14316 [Aphanomyces stellatus]|uniref:Aste57867_14316 protein n=1 Tax=Aphanomyces stellatus TaxID=120398 RepID=A0A485L214_9STRA|nr:hypothetical protein As57867_014263 [Aphanomyces stellatus]VFT91140.1 Aste57867_14316 [Aphanomyces stellatus]